MDSLRVAETCSRVNDLEAEEQKIGKRVSEANAELSRLETKLVESKILVEKIRYIESLGASSREVCAVVEAALRSAASKGYSTSEAFASLTRDLNENYGVTRSLREEADLLVKKRENKLQLIAEEEQRLNSLRELILRLEKAFSAHKKLNEGGVSDKDLVSINSVMVEYGDDVSTFKKKIDELGGLDRYVAEKRVEADKLGARLSQLNSIILGKEERLRKLDEAFTQSWKKNDEQLNTFLKNIESYSRNIYSKLNSLIEKQFNDVRARDGNG